MLSLLYSIQSGVVLLTYYQHITFNIRMQHSYLYKLYQITSRIFSN